MPLISALFKKPKEIYYTYSLIEMGAYSIDGSYYC